MKTNTKVKTPTDNLFDISEEKDNKLVTTSLDKDLEKIKNNELDFLTQLQVFTAILNQEPPDLELAVNKYAKNSLYIPIGILQMKLDKVFYGLWKTENFRAKVIGNEIVGEIELSVFHPVAKEWIKKTGAAATMIRFKEGSKSFEFENKIINALEMDYPHLKADCERNAIAELGKFFGRDLNRDKTVPYSAMMPTLNNDFIIEIRGKLMQYTTSEEVKDNSENLINEYRNREGITQIDILTIQNEIKNYRAQLIKNEKNGKA